MVYTPSGAPEQPRSPELANQHLIPLPLCPQGLVQGWARAPRGPMSQPSGFGITGIALFSFCFLEECDKGLKLKVATSERVRDSALITDEPLNLASLPEASYPWTCYSP